MSEASWIALLVAAFFGIGVVLFRRAPEDWRVDWPFVAVTRGPTLAISWVLLFAALGAFLLTLVDPGLFSN